MIATLSRTSAASAAAVTRSTRPHRRTPAMTTRSHRAWRQDSRITAARDLRRRYRFAAPPALDVGRRTRRMTSAAAPLAAPTTRADVPSASQPCLDRELLGRPSMSPPAGPPRHARGRRRAQLITCSSGGQSQPGDLVNSRHRRPWRRVLSAPRADCYSGPRSSLRCRVPTRSFWVRRSPPVGLVARRRP